jgi:predicted ABC-type ATPase
VRPFIFVLAGVNGAGKSSVGGAILQDHGLAWFNPDACARELRHECGVDAAEANARAWEFGRHALERAVSQGTNFAFETTLGGTTISRLLADASTTHSVLMLYCGLTTPDLHVARVVQRVAHGGHPIPEARIRERWDTSRLNLIKLLPHLSQLQVFDNSTEAAAGEPIPDPRLLLHLRGSRIAEPRRLDAAALAAIPTWARPIAEAAMQLSSAKRLRAAAPRSR